MLACMASSQGEDMRMHMHMHARLSKTALIATGCPIKFAHNLRIYVCIPNPRSIEVP